MSAVTKLISLNTDLNADAVEWCPIQEFHHLLVCATYELAEDEAQECSNAGTGQFRRGFLYLYELQQDLSLNELSKYETPGILDCKWSRRRISGNICIATVDAKGTLRLFKFDGEEVSLEETTKLVELSSLDVTGDGTTLLLSLDWSNVLKTSGDDCFIIASDSGGCVHLVSLTGSDLKLASSRKAHDFEAWIAAFDYFNTNVFYSGGDDCKLKVHDKRLDPDNPVQTLKDHTAGVTSIQCNWLQEHSLVSGSYDERVLFWDSRSMRRPVDDVKAPGGVWRIKHDPFDCRFIASPCMYGGSAVIDSTLPTPSVVATYVFHSSINYGIDWCWKEMEWNESKNVRLLSVCSFYDKLLSLATFSATPV